MKGNGTKEIEEQVEQLLADLRLSQEHMFGQKREKEQAEFNFHLEDVRIAADAEGTNAEKRKADIVDKRQSDEGYRAAQEAVRAVGRTYDEAIVIFDDKKRQYHTKVVILELRAAQLKFLGSEV